MSLVKTGKRNDIIEDFEVSKETKTSIGNKRIKNDLNIQMTKTPDFNRSISLQSSKKKDQKGCHTKSYYLHFLQKPFT